MKWNTLTNWFPAPGHINDADLFDHHMSIWVASQHQCRQQSNLFVQGSLTSVNKTKYLGVQFISLFPCGVMENIYCVFRPFYFLLKFCGLLPMSFLGPARNGVLSFKWSDLLASFWCFTIMIMMVWMNILDHNILIDYSTVLSTAWILSLFFGFLAVLMMFLYNLFKCQTHKKLLESVSEFDRMVRGWTVNIQILNYDFSGPKLEHESQLQTA